MTKQPIQKSFTILHSNDIHGDFQSEVVDGKPGKMVGGLARHDATPVYFTFSKTSNSPLSSPSHL